jgi:hypothetical protein
MDSPRLFNDDRGADISPDGRYRYRLWRGPEPRLGWIMLNPSTADADDDDPTIRRCRSFAAANGYTGILVVNMFAYRATDPRDLPDDATVATGPWNGAAIARAIRECDTVVAAWGARYVPTIRRQRADHAGGTIRAIAARHGTRLVALGYTDDGAPRHPLMVPNGTPFVMWPRPRWSGH